MAPALAVLSLLAAEPKLGFAGFSEDGQRFAWIAPGASKAMKSEFVKIISPGTTEPQMSILFPGDKESEKEAHEKLKGFSDKRTPAPKDLKIEAKLTAKPPELTLVRGAKRVAVDMGKYPFESTDVAELWGVSHDGKHVAIWVHGPDVPGLLSKGGGNDFQLYVIAPVP